ncbi:MAG: hypothetical protein ACQESP_11735 [Candidatus Muiribacteriota bacterium]
MNNIKNDNYNQKIDNELKKKELEEKYGARFNQESNISPELENEWLNSIEQFEQQFSNSKTIKLWQYIGEPTFKKFHDLKPEEISIELQRLMDIMNDHNICLDTLCDVDKKELYRFITEELFVYEMNNVRIEGMNTCFIYEDFHPNAEYDIEQAYDYFFRMTMAKMENIGGDGYDLLYINTKNYINSKEEKLDEKIVIEKINNFLDSYDYFEIISNQINKIIINKDKTDAQLSCNIHYKGCFNKSSESITFKGNGIFKFKPCEYGGWNIYHMNIPGLQI